MADTGYRFIDKDPAVDVARFAMEQAGFKGRGRFAHVAEEAGVSASTVRNLDLGKTRKPQHATFRAIMQACGFVERWVKVGERKALTINYNAERGQPVFKFGRL
jgi:hypothetical protein